MKKILIFDQYPFIGGGQTVLLEVIQSLLDANIQPKLIAPMGGPLEKEISTRFGNKVTTIDSPVINLNHGKKGISDLLLLIYHTVSGVIRNLSNTFSVDALYINAPRWFLVGAILSFLSKKPIFIHLHLQHRGVEKFLLSFCILISHRPKVIANSNYTKSKLKTVDKLCGGASTFVLVENCLPEKSSNCVFENRFIHYNGTLNVVVLGVLRPEKGQNLAVQLASNNMNILMHIVGRTGEGAEEWVSNLKMAATTNVIFHGNIANVPLFLSEKNIQINLVPSIWDEPFGLVAIEGMANSCITIVSNRGSLPDIATNTGAIVFDGRFDELQNKFNALFELDKSSLTDIATKQHLNTTAYYAPANFRTKLLKTLTPQLS